MKSIIIICFVFLFIISCKSIEINPTDIIGKWQPSLYIPYNSKDDTWGKAFPIDSLSKKYIIDFTNDNKFLINGKPGGSCCSAGDKYSISGNEINFSELTGRGCAYVFCKTCTTWNIDKVGNETLILEECGKYKIQYVKTK